MTGDFAQNQKVIQQPRDQRLQLLVLRFGFAYLGGGLLRSFLCGRYPSVGIGFYNNPIARLGIDD